MPSFKRQPAYQLWISSIMNANTIKKEGAFEPTTLQVNGAEIIRVHLVGTVIDKYESNDKNFVSITLDDGSSSIKAKTWREDTTLIQNIQKGAITRVIGKIRSYNDETYLIPEIVREVGPNWELVHKLQLLKLQGKPERIVQKQQVMDKVEEEIVISESDRQKILALIEKLDREEGGANKQKIMEQSHIQEDTINTIIEDLMKEGEIFELKGQLKTMS